MLYDVDFLVAGLIFLLIIYIYVRIQYNNQIDSIKILRRLIVFLFLADSADIVTSITISYAEHVPLWLNYVLNILFFELDAICISTFPKYVNSILPDSMRSYTRIDRINDILLFVYAIITASTPFTHLIFFFSDDLAYNHGSMYLMIFVIPVWFMICAFARLMANKKTFTRRQFYSIFGFIFIAISGPALQSIWPSNHIIDFYALSLATFIIVIGLETPDFIKLEKALKELEASQTALKEAVTRAESADKAKSDFLASMSHEIRTPINAILGMNELISRESSEDTVRSYSANVADAGQSLLSLINEILDFSKIEAGKMELAPVDYRFSILLREVYNIINIRCAKKGLHFSVENNPGIPNLLYGDEARIRQILINLLNNAVKYTDVGNVTLKLDFESTGKNSVTLIASISDTGIGIRKEDIPQLFESFKRIDLKHNRNREGTGLGLNISKSFVELMSGSISVQSVYGSGSTFTVRIPQTVKGTDTIGSYDPASSVPTQSSYKSSFTAPDAKILVVDDVPVNLMVIKGLLKKSEMTIDTALSGAECLEMIDKEKYDLIFLDHMMPQMDGIETLEKMKQNSSPLNINTPIVMLTANAILGAKEEYIQAGFVDYLSKPVKPAELEQMIRQYLPADKLISSDNQ